MSSAAYAARLAALTRELLESWHQTRESWMDAKAREFEDGYLRELESAVNSAVIGIENLEAVLRKVRSDCE